MNDDLIARLLAGPGSRELDADVFLATNPDYKLAKNSLGKTIVMKGGHRWSLDGIVLPLTTSLDAAESFAVAVVGTQKAIQVFRDAQDKTWEGPAGWFDALPRYIVAETLKARGGDR